MKLINQVHGTDVIALGGHQNLMFDCAHVAARVAAQIKE
jgi:hypothetical protein